jgi:hypothetical protein
MPETVDQSKKPHWAWPHVVGVALALVVYFIVYRFTGDSDLFIAIAAGAGGIVATWAYIRFLWPLWTGRTPPGS